ncbi:nitrate- and nitrite sensing domain-containing protein [Rouxiella sp. Mn2063]|uniref:nitrate- and nitrite sensing domain-containing protein n=1 Tax=Rouxiella sp. Mn2063 TaxID=3395262 RepID=UPI003BC9D8CA
MKKPLLSTALDFVAAAKKSEIAGLEHLLQMGKLVGAVSQFIHVLQRERGIANIYLCSQDPAFGEALSERALQVSLAQQVITQQVEHLKMQTATPTSTSRLYSRIAALLRSMTTLDELRKQVALLAIGQPSAMQQYCDVIKCALALVFEAADTPADPQISRALLAMFSFMQGKELTGQERALAAAGFAARAFDDTLRQQLLNLIEGQERCFQTFIEFADARARDIWYSQLAQDSSEFERFRRIAYTRATLDGEPQNMALRWFTVATARIDDMKIIEDLLEDILMERCRESIAIATSSLEQNLLNNDGGWLPEHPHYSVFVSADAANAQAYQTEGIAPQLGRSILELVGQQSRRLQQLDTELAELRASLSERKQIEKAKGLLMQHKGMTEEQAHKTLRNMAMNQNKKLSDIAAAMLSVATLLGE